MRKVKSLSLGSQRSYFKIELCMLFMVDLKFYIQVCEAGFRYCQRMLGCIIDEPCFIDFGQKTYDNQPFLPHYFYSKKTFTV